MSELNRPAGLGPWSSEVWKIENGCVLHPASVRAIADLPAWIEAHDEWKARAERMGSELLEVMARAERAEAALDDIRVQLFAYGELGACCADLLHDILKFFPKDPE